MQQLNLAVPSLLQVDDWSKPAEAVLRPPSDFIKTAIQAGMIGAPEDHQSVYATPGA